MNAPPAGASLIPFAEARVDIERALDSAPSALRDVLRMFLGAVREPARAMVAVVDRWHVAGSLQVSQDDRWATKARVCAIYVRGDCTIDEDFVSDLVEPWPLLIIGGSLRLRSWLKNRQGVFVLGDVMASGALLPEGDDGVVRIGGRLRVADVYVNGWKPMPELRDGHVISGGVEGPQVNWSATQTIDQRASYAREHFHPSTIVRDGDSGFPEEFDGLAALSLVASGERLWRG